MILTRVQRNRCSHVPRKYSYCPLVNFIQPITWLGLSEDLSTCAGPEDQVVSVLETHLPPISSGYQDLRGLSPVLKGLGCYTKLHNSHISTSRGELAEASAVCLSSLAGFGWNF